MKLSPNEVAHVVLAAGFTGEDAVNMIAIAGAESGFDTEALARTNSLTSPYLGQRALGLFMISNQAHPEKIIQGDWRDPYINAGWAFRVFKASGIKAWNVTQPKPNGDPAPYLAFMPDARIAIKTPVSAPRSEAVRHADIMKAIGAATTVVNSLAERPSATRADIALDFETMMRSFSFGVQP